MITLLQSIRTKPPREHASLDTLIVELHRSNYKPDYMGRAYSAKLIVLLYARVGI